MPVRVIIAYVLIVLMIAAAMALVRHLRSEKRRNSRRRGSGRR